MLEQLRSEGEFDSLGAFTLSLDKAVEKIRLLAEQDPSRWLLFAVQAAVAGEAERVSVSLEHDRCSVTLWLPAAAESLANSGELLETATDPSPMVRSLRSAVLWARAHQPEQLDVLYGAPDGGYLLCLAGSEPARSPRPAEPYARLQILARFPERSLARTAGWSRALADRLRFCPVPVTLDGLLLTTGQGGDPGYLFRYFLAAPGERPVLACVAPVSVPALRVRAGSSEKTRTREGDPFPLASHVELGGAIPENARLVAPGEAPGWTVAEWQQGRQHSWVLADYEPPRLAPPLDTFVPCRALLTRVHSDENWLFVVKHGCTLDPLPLPAMPGQGWQMSVAADTIATDLSGSKVISTDDVVGLQEWAVQHILFLHARLAGAS